MPPTPKVIIDISQLPDWKDSSRDRPACSPSPSMTMRTPVSNHSTTSVQSRNPAGTFNKTLRQIQFEKPALEVALGFRCESLSCNGIGVADEADVMALTIRMNELNAIRIKFAKRSSGDGIAQLLLNFFWELTPDRTTPIAVSQMRFSVGAQTVCHWCWATAADLVTHHSSPLRKKESWSRAMAAYRKGHTEVSWTRSTAKVLTKPAATKVNTAMGWLNEHAKPEQAHTQQVATDDGQHFQATARVDLWNTMNAEMRKQGRLPALAILCCYTTFLSALRMLKAAVKSQHRLAQKV